MPDIKTPVKHEKCPLSQRMGLQPFRRTKILFIADGLHALLTARWCAILLSVKKIKESHAAWTEIASFSQNRTSPEEN